MRQLKEYLFFRQAKKSCILCLAILSHFANYAFAHSGPLAILGGQGNAPYAAFLRSDGKIVKLSGLPTTGLTYRVAMNLSGYAIIGGTDGINAYAALVSPNGDLQPITGLQAPGEIYTVAINQSGKGIIGGGYLSGNTSFAALVSNSGIATILDVPASGLIYSVALNNTGLGIIAGIGPLNSAYASLVTSDGTLQPLLNLPTTGAIYWAAINDSKMSFIGGQDNTTIYAAFVDANGNVSPIANLPQGTNYSVGLNAAGNAIMGGTSLNLPYAALVNRSGTVTTLTGLPSTPGKIYNVAINDSGTGLIAGYSTQGPYGSLVAPNGKLTPLKGLPTGDGFLDGAALHAAGVGIVGGTIANSPFAAIVAPNGNLTYLSGLPSQGQINSIAMSVLDYIVPQSLGTYDSWANTQFTLSDALTQHSFLQLKGRQNACAYQIHESSVALNHHENTSVWLSTFGNFVNENAQSSLPRFSNKIAGLILGLDYGRSDALVVGGGLAYSHNAVNYAHDGDASINQESVVIYATWNNTQLYLNAALWGGSFQTTNNRSTLGLVTSTANPSGWNIAPHLELNLPLQLASSNALIISPFVAFDWANNWQYHFREHGSSGLNIKLNDQYAAILQSELGLRFFETYQHNWGKLILEEKISYINRSTTQKGGDTASFIGAISNFEVATLSSATRNLGSVQMHAEFVPCNIKDMYAALDYQGEFGSSLTANMLSLSVGKNF